MLAYRSPISRYLIHLFLWSSSFLDLFSSSVLSFSLLVPSLSGSIWTMYCIQMPHWMLRPPDWILQKQTDGIVSLDNTSPYLMYFSLVYLSDWGFKLWWLLGGRSFVKAIILLFAIFSPDMHMKWSRKKGTEMFVASTNSEGFGALQSWWMMNQKCPCGTLVQNAYWQASSFYKIGHE